MTNSSTFLRLRLANQKGSERVTVYANFRDQELVISNLSAESIPQICRPGGNGKIKFHFYLRYHPEPILVRTGVTKLDRRKYE